MEEVIKNKFHDGKIYVIRSKQTDKIYIGSTCSKLASRLLYHRQYKKRNDRTGEHNVTSNIIINYDDHYIELLEKFKCENKEELERREGELIKQNINICVNNKIPGRTSEEYYDDNKIKLRKYHKEYAKKKCEDEKYKIERNERYKTYYKDNKEELTKQKATIIKCVCGQDTTQGHKARHEKSKKHLLFISSHPIQEIPIINKEDDESSSDSSSSDSSSSDSSSSDSSSSDSSSSEEEYKPTQEQKERIECAK